MPVVRDFGKIFEGVPRGSWVTLSHDEERVVACDVKLEEAIRKAKEAGEPEPYVIRNPDNPTLLAL